MEELLTMKEMAKLLKVSQATLINWRKLGMPFKRVGRGIRFERKEAIEWVEAQSKVSE